MENRGLPIAGPGNVEPFISRETMSQAPCSFLRSPSWALSEAATAVASAIAAMQMDFMCETFLYVRSLSLTKRSGPGRLAQLLNEALDLRPAPFQHRAIRQLLRHGAFLVLVDLNAQQR